MISYKDLIRVRLWHQKKLKTWAKNLHLPSYKGIKELSFSSCNNERENSYLVILRLHWRDMYFWETDLLLLYLPVIRTNTIVYENFLSHGGTNPFGFCLFNLGLHTLNKGREFYFWFCSRKEESVSMLSSLTPTNTPLTGESLP